MKKYQAPRLPDWLEKQMPFKRYRIKVGSFFMHVSETGNGDIPVIMLHGNPTWGFLYRKVCQDLNLNKFKIFLPDLIGLGFSDKPTDENFHTLENHAYWFGEFIKQLNFKKVIFVVQDWGGPICFRALFDKKNYKCGLVVLNTAISPPKKGFKSSTFHKFSRIPYISEFTFRKLGFPQNLINLGQGKKTRFPKEISLAYTFPLKNKIDNLAPLALARMVPNNFSHPSIRALEKSHEFCKGFKGPVQIVWGNKDPVLGRLKNHVLKTFSTAEITETQGGHFLQEEVPDKIADAVDKISNSLF